MDKRGNGSEMIYIGGTFRLYNLKYAFFGFRLFNPNRGEIENTKDA